MVQVFTMKHQGVQMLISWSN